MSEDNLQPGLYGSVRLAGSIHLYRVRSFLFEFREALRNALDAIWQNKLRAVLTTLGIIIGIVMVTTTMTTINGMERAFDRSMAMLGTNTYYVQQQPWFHQPSESWKFRRRPRLTAEQATRVTDAARESRYLQAAAPSVSFGSAIQYRDRVVRFAFAQATVPAYTRVADVDLATGRYFTDFETRTARNVVVIGSEVAKNLFPNERALGKRVRIAGQRFEVIGVLKSQGKFLGLFSMDEQFQLPITVFQKLYGNSRRSYEVNIRAVDGATQMQVEDEIRGITRVVRRLDALDEDDFSINRSEAFREMVSGVKATIYGVGLFLTALALVVGGIGVMNIMFVSVKERTREIGIRKAMGARQRAIMLQFLLEAVAISLLGGVLGILLTIPITMLINSVFTAYLSAGVVALAFAICVGVGIIFGILPAWRAARANPIEALRYE